MMETKSIAIVKRDGVITNSTLYIYIKESRFSADSLVRLLNAVEALLYQGLISSISKIQRTFPGVNSYGGVSYEPLRESGKIDDYKFLESIKHNFEDAYTSFLIEKYIYGRISEKKEQYPLGPMVYKEFIDNKFWKRPDFDYREFIEWVRSYSSASLSVVGIRTENSLELFFDFATIASIIALQNYPVVDNIVRFFIEKLKQAVKDKLHNPKSPEKELITVVIKDKGEEIIIHEIENKSSKYDVVIQFGEGKFIHYKAE